MDILNGKNLLPNNDFKNGAEGWEAVNLCLKSDARNAYFEVVSEAKFNHTVADAGDALKGSFAHFRTGNIHTWLTLSDGVLLPAGEYVWNFAVKSYSTHVMFGVYSTKEVGCDDRLIPAMPGSRLTENGSDGQQVTEAFAEIGGRYQKEWPDNEIPVYVTVEYRFALERETRVFPAIRGRSEAAVNSRDEVGIQSMYIGGLALKCLKLYNKKADDTRECLASFDFNNPTQENYAGLSAIFPCFWFLKDDSLENPYTEEQLRISVNKLLNMGIKIVRCVAFEPSYAWDGERHLWDWESDWMRGFYKYCDIMRENDIDIILNTAEGITSPITQLGRENPIYFLAVNSDPELFKGFSAAEADNEQIAVFRSELSKWVAEFAREVIVKRGYTNIKYWMEGTEVNNSSNEDSKFNQWIGLVGAVHLGLKAAKMRDKVKIVGPATGFWRTFKGAKSFNWLDWCAEDYSDLIDICASHTYGFPYVMGDDIAEQYDEFTRACVGVTAKAGKLFWHDEFNVLTDFGIYRESAEHPMHATQIALGQLRTMACGANTTMLWYPVDIKWPNRRDTCFPSWVNGVHILGLDKSILSGDPVPRYGYYVYCMLGGAIKAGDTVYAAEFSENKKLYTVLLKHTDGSLALVTVNMSNLENKVAYRLDTPNKLVFERLVYDPDKFELPQKGEVGIGVDEFEQPTPQNRLITKSSEIETDGSLLHDAVAPFNVVVYRQKNSRVNKQ